MATRRGPDNTVRFSIGGQINSVNWASVFWAALTTSGTPAQADLDTWLNAAQAAYKTNFAARSQSTVTYTQAQAQLFLPSSGLLTSLMAMTGAGTGTASGAVPQDACEVISWQINAYWRGGKPRTYLPMPPAADFNNAKSLTSTAQAAVVTAANAYRTAINGLSSGAITATALGTVSFRSGNADRVPPVFFAYTTSKCHPRIGSQRRRLGKWLP